MNLGNKLVAQLVSYPMGGLWARFMPAVNIFGVSLNPGPFTIKEHVGTDSFHLGIILSVYSGIGHNHGWCRITICLCGKRNHMQTKSVWADGQSVQTDIIAVQRVLYKQTWSFMCKGGRSCGCLA